MKRQKKPLPLQSLVLMNDPQYVEASRKLAERMMRETGNIRSADQLCFQSPYVKAPARPQELELMKELYAGELKFSSGNPKRIKELVEYR